MDEDASAPEALDDLVALVTGGLVDALVRQLRSSYTSLGNAEIEDVVAGSIERVVARIQKGPLHGDLAAYVYKATLNGANKAARQKARRAEVSLAPDLAQPTADVADDVLRRQVVQLLLAEVRSWENANIRVVTLVYLEAAVAGEPLDSVEVAELASPVLGEELNPASVRKWKARGMQKLRDFLQHITDPDTHGKDPRP